MRIVNFSTIIEKAWQEYDESREIKSIKDISAMVSTNHVYKVDFTDGDFIIAKLSYFGIYEHFKEDHNIIHALANNLRAPFQNFLAKSLMKGSSVFTFRYTDDLLDAWVVFYNPIKAMKKMPRRLEDRHIAKLGEQIALFHKSCHQVRKSLPPSSKTMTWDMNHLQELIKTEVGREIHHAHLDEIKLQIDKFNEERERLNSKEFDKIPVFVDWNIGNFSVNKSGNLFSRWDYDWFRMSSRILDFYFMSRVCSDIGDRTVFSYWIDPLMEDRFILFLKEYHQVFPLKAEEILFIKEAYRFFLLNYVVKDGRYFFHELYANRLQFEAFKYHFPSIEEKFNPDKILKALGLN